MIVSKGAHPSGAPQARHPGGDRARSARERRAAARADRRLPAAPRRPVGAGGNDHRAPHRAARSRPDPRVRHLELDDGADRRGQRVGGRARARGLLPEQPAPVARRPRTRSSGRTRGRPTSRRCSPGTSGRRRRCWRGPRRRAATSSAATAQRSLRVYDNPVNRERRRRARAARRAARPHGVPGRAGVGAAPALPRLRRASARDTADQVREAFGALEVDPAELARAHGVTAPRMKSMIA